MKLSYAVIFKPFASGWSAYAIDLPGFGAGAETLEELRLIVPGAIKAHLETLVSLGAPVPASTVRAGTVKTDIVGEWSDRLAKSA